MTLRKSLYGVLFMEFMSFLAADLGASNGRVILGEFDGGKIKTTELHRFANEPVTVLGHNYWDILRLFLEVNRGISCVSRQYGKKLKSIGIDSWGNDFALINKDGHLLANPNHYRNSHLDGIVERKSGIISEREIFNITGIGTSKYNMVYQLLAMYEFQPETVNCAAKLLMIPDIFVYFLTGEISAEFTNATTSQFMGRDRAGWSKQIAERFNINLDILPEIKQPGSYCGKVLPYMCENFGQNSVNVVATIQHDTAAAVAATPMMDAESVFISSGTWSLVGTETDRLYINDLVYESYYTNEGGLEGKNLLLRNTVGMWPLQECVREWKQNGEEHDYEILIEKTQKCKPFVSFIDTDSTEFSMPGNLPGKIRKFCERTNQPIPATNAEIFRCIMESLAFKYCWCISRLEEILGRRLKRINIVGGGSRNTMLNQFTANATNKSVVCGPSEAASVGNLLAQALAAGEISNLRELRQVAANSFPCSYYEPCEAERWNMGYMAYLEVLDEAKLLNI